MKGFFSPNGSESDFYILSEYHIYALLTVTFGLIFVLWYAKFCNDLEKVNRLRLGLAGFLFLAASSVPLDWQSLCCLSLAAGLCV